MRLDYNDHLLTNKRWTDRQTFPVLEELEAIFAMSPPPPSLTTHKTFLNRISLISLLV